MTIKLISIVLTLTFILSPVTVNAYSDQELDKIVKDLKNEIEQLKGQSPDGLTNKIEKVDKKSRRRDKTMRSNFEKYMERVKINGFGSAGITMADEDLGTRHRFTKTPSFKSDSILGLQVKGQVSEKFDFVTQLIAEGSQYWDIRPEWVYISYQSTPGLNFAIGRQRIPFYMFSKSLDVGFTYPWARLPREVYYEEISAYDGISARYKFNLGGITNVVEVYGGEYQREEPVVNSKDTFGINVTSSKGPFSWRLHVFKVTFVATIDFTNVMSPELIAAFGLEDFVDVPDKLSYYTGSFMYDKDAWMILAEASTFRADGGNFFGNIESGYIFAAYRINQWLPYITYAYTQTLDDSDFDKDLLGLPVDLVAVSQGKSAILGVRYNFDSNVSAKFEWQHSYDFDNTNGEFTADPKDIGNNANIVTFIIDVVF